MTDKPKRTRLKKGDKHYVNNKEFTAALHEYSKKCRQRLEEGKERPEMPRYIGESFMKIAERLSMRPNFRGYSYRDEMVQDAILAACKYAHRFNGDRYDNGFSYITQVMFSHMVQRIKKEKKKYELNLKLIQEGQHMLGLNDESNAAEETAKAYADEKLGDLAEAKVGKDKKTGHSKGGFTLRSHMLRVEGEIKAIEEGRTEFEVEGKHYKVREEKRAEYFEANPDHPLNPNLGHNGGPKID